MLEKFEGEKRKQYLVMGVVFVLGVGTLFFLSEATGGRKREKVRAEAPPVRIIDERKVEEESFKSVYGRRLMEIEEELKRIRMEKEKLERELERMRKEEEMRSKAQAVKVPQKTLIPKPPPPPTSTPAQGAGADVPAPATNMGQKKLQQSITIPENLIVIDVDESEASGESVPSVPRSGEEGEGVRKVGDYIPAGSFVPVVLLHGLMAPATGKALSNPLPVLMRVVDMSVLPNRWRVDVKDCFIVGAGYGDLSSERAYIRAETLSCVKENGEIIEAKVQGHVSGEDGKLGLAGRVVSKQGQLLARTLMAGFLEGVAKAFQASSTTIAISPQGAVQTVNPEDALNVGIFSGAAEASRKLADFYMKLADQMFPVIEVNAGRRADVVFLKNVRLGGEE